MNQVNDNIDSQHIYQLAGNQHIRFMKKVGGELVYDGTTNEQVIEVLLHRITGLNEKFPCFENEMALEQLKTALYWLNARTKKRVAQGVEGQDLPHHS